MWVNLDQIGPRGDGLAQSRCYTSHHRLSTFWRQGAFLWVFIWSLRGTLKLRNLSFLGSDRMDNLLKAHS